MVCLLEQLFSVIWCEETLPKQWREGLIVKNGDREDPGNYRGISPLSVVGKVFCKVLTIKCKAGLGRIKICVLSFRCTESV